jgi:hypothetical protein
VRKHLNADVLFKAVKKSFERIKDPFGETPQITLPDALMSAFAMLSLKSPTLLAFDRSKNGRGTQPQVRLWNREDPLRHPDAHAS